MSESPLERRVVPLAVPQGLPWRSADPAAPSGVRIKGFTVVHLLDWLEETRGTEAVAGWVATLPDAVRPTVDRRALTSVGWLPIELYFHGVRHVVDTFHGGDVRGALHVGHAMASRDIGAFFRAAMRFASPTTVLSLSGRFWKSYFDQSELVVTGSTPKSCTAEIHGWPFNDPVSWHELGGSLVAWMEASRAQEVRLTHFEVAGPGLLRLEATWT
ncbi:MAG: hypothetical protein AB1730_07720 [Myxococcota bacterium]